MIIHAQTAHCSIAASSAARAGGPRFLNLGAAGFALLAGMLFVATPIAQAANATPGDAPQAAPAMHAGAGSTEAGERVFMKCRACHQIGPGARNVVGPELNGLLGRKAASIEGYRFSDAMKNAGLTWDDATLQAFLKEPRVKVPGTRMFFVGLKKDKELADLLAYIQQFDASGNKKP